MKIIMQRMIAWREFLMLDDEIERELRRTLSSSLGKSFRRTIKRKKPTKQMSDSCSHVLALAVNDSALLILRK